MIKKIVVVLLLTCQIATAWADQENFEGRVRLTAIPVEISANSLPLADLLALLSEQSGISIMATPEVAGPMA